MFKWKPSFSPFRITYKCWIWPIPSYHKEPPCALRTPSTWWCSQWKQYNTAWRLKKKYESTVGYNLRRFQGWQTSLYSNESLYKFSPLRITYQFWIWPIPSYLKEPPCALRTPSTCSWSQCKQYNTAWRLKKKYESTVGYNLRSFQGWPTNLYSNKSLGSPLSE